MPVICQLRQEKRRKEPSQHRRRPAINGKKVEGLRRLRQGFFGVILRFDQRQGNAQG